MASDQLVTAQIILDAQMELQRRGSKEVQAHLEKIEPDLFSYISEHSSMIYQKLMALGGRPRETHRTYLAIQKLVWESVMALRQANLKLWEKSIEDTPLARIAGRDDKPLPPMPVTKIWGIGPAMAARLKMLGINTIGDLRKFPLEVLREQIGDEAEHYHRLAHGIDDRPVATDREAKSIRQELTFDVDVGNPEAVRVVLLEQIEQVARRLRKHGLAGRTVTVKIRFGQFETITRSITLEAATNITVELENAATTIFDRWVTKSFQPVRLIGVTASQLNTGETQMGLFADPDREKQQRLDTVSDAISLRFGTTAIRRGGSFK